MLKGTFPHKKRHLRMNEEKNMGLRPALAAYFFLCLGFLNNLRRTLKKIPDFTSRNRGSLSCILPIVNQKYRVLISNGAISFLSWLSICNNLQYFRSLVLTQKHEKKTQRKQSRRTIQKKGIATVVILPRYSSSVHILCNSLLF